MSAVAVKGSRAKICVFDAYRTLFDRAQQQPPQLGQVFSEVIGPAVQAEFDGRPSMPLSQDQWQDEFECSLLVNAFAMWLFNRIGLSDLHKYKWSALKLRLTQVAVLIQALDASAGAPELA